MLKCSLLWSPVTGATGYNVKRSLAGAGPYTVIATTAGTFYTNSPVTNGTTYYYIVSALNSVGEGADSTPASALPLSLPAMPGGLAASVTNSQVNLAWAPVSGALGYNVKRSLTNGGAYSVLGVIAATNWTDSAVAIGTPYYYVVSALNAAGESPNSAQVSATVPQAPGILWTNIAAGNWSAGTSWQGGTAPPADGLSTYIVKYNTTPYSGVSINDLSGTFVLNQLQFGAALPALTNRGNMLQFIVNGAIPPQLLQNSTKAVTLSNNVSLATATTIGGSGAGTLTLAGVISGPGSLIQSNSSVLVLPSVNTFSGGATLSAGTLTPYSDGSGAAKNWLGTGPVTLAGGTIFKPGDLTGQPLRLANAVVLSGGMAGISIPFGGATDLKLDGPISGSGGLAISGGTRGLTMQGNNSFSGGVTLSDGNNVQIASPTALGTGTLRLGNSSGGILRAMANLATGLGVTNPIDLTSGWTLTVDSGSYTLELSGPITNTGSITKTSSGTLILSGTNTYSGKTTVSAGVLQVTSPASLGTGTDVYLTTSSGSLDLEFTGAAVVHALYINGTKQANGLYGSSTAPITGPGYLLVGPPARQPALSATAGNALVNLNWNAVARGERLHREAVPGDAMGPLPPLGYTSGTNYTDTGLNNGTWYYYVVAAHDTRRRKRQFGQAAAKPLAPIPPTPACRSAGSLCTNGVPSFSFTAAADLQVPPGLQERTDGRQRGRRAWSTNTTGSPQSMTLTDPNAGGQPHRFYRLEAANP